jgi:hypothetical protein
LTASFSGTDVTTIEQNFLGFSSEAEYFGEVIWLIVFVEGNQDIGYIGVESFDEEVDEDRTSDVGPRGLSLELGDIGWNGHLVLTEISEFLLLLDGIRRILETILKGVHKESLIFEAAVLGLAEALVPSQRILLEESSGKRDALPIIQETRVSSSDIVVQLKVEVVIAIGMTIVGLRSLELHRLEVVRWIQSRAVARRATSTVSALKLDLSLYQTLSGLYGPCHHGQKFSKSLRRILREHKVRWLWKCLTTTPGL